MVHTIDMSATRFSCCLQSCTQNLFFNASPRVDTLCWCFPVCIRHPSLISGIKCTHHWNANVSWHGVPASYSQMVELDWLGSWLRSRWANYAKQRRKISPHKTRTRTQHARVSKPIFLSFHEFRPQSVGPSVRPCAAWNQFSPNK